MVSSGADIVCDLFYRISRNQCWQPARGETCSYYVNILCVALHYFKNLITHHHHHHSHCNRKVHVLPLLPSSFFFLPSFSLDADPRSQHAGYFFNNQRWRISLFSAAVGDPRRWRRLARPLLDAEDHNQKNNRELTFFAHLLYLPCNETNHIYQLKSKSGGKK